MSWRLIAVLMMGVSVLQPVARPAAAPRGAAGTKAAPTAARNPAELVERDRLVRGIEELPHKRAARADAEHLEGLYKTQELLIKRLGDLGLKVELDEVDFLGSTHDAKRPLYSIIADIPGKSAGAPGTTREVVMVGAHFDAVPGSPGADDNGTGVSALLEMARVLKDQPMERTVRLCFFNLEEQGMVGSSKYALDIGDRVRTKKEKIVLMLSMDMLGYYRTEQGSQRTFIPEETGFKSPKEGDFIAVVTTLRHRPSCQDFVKHMKTSCAEAKVVAIDFLPALTELLRSDHAPFLGMGIPSLLITDTADYRSPHYHKATDTIETLDVERYLLTVKALTGAVWETAKPVRAR